MRILGTAAGTLLFLAVGITAQEVSRTPVSADTKISDVLARNLDNHGPKKDVPRDRREQAYAKLLEGQRYIWSSGRLRSQAGVATTSRLARQSFVRAVELDPSLAEGYTALAELSLNIPPGDIDEAISLAGMAIRIDPDNFGARRIRARLFTVRSQLNGTLDAAFAAKAIEEWREVARLDPRNAEAWAFLSAFYEKQGRQDDQIAALRKWIASAVPVDRQFYTRYMGQSETLAPESGSLKLGPALIKAGKTREGIETLSVLVADDPDNATAVELLREALESAEANASAVSLEALQQAVGANPGNIPLLTLLARLHARSGRVDEAAKLLANASARLAATDKHSASSLQIALADMYAGMDRPTESIAAFDEALKLRGISETAALGSDDREFAVYVFERMIGTLKSANRPVEVRAVIERARRQFGKDDLFAERQLIAFYREAGKKAEALAAVKAARVKSPSDNTLVRLEATLLAETGRVDEAVTAIKRLMQARALASPGGAAIAPDAGPTVALAVPMFDDFSNYLFISNLYTQAGRSKEAADAANQAYSVARGAERRQIARLTLASAQQASGDAAAAEATLRAILKESPGNPIALNNLGYFLLERNERLDEALQMIQQAVSVDPTNPSYLDSLGWAYFKLGKLDEAEAKLKEAARHDSASATIQEHLGDVYQKQGKPDLAKAAWERALNIASETGDTERLRSKLGIKATK